MTERIVKRTEMGAHGKDPYQRNIQDLLNLGVVIIDKPKGPTSHQVSAWVRQMLGLKKAGHGGTLDPNVSGVLPIMLGDATRLADLTHLEGKEYITLMHMHQSIPQDKVEQVLINFTGPIYQFPPVRSAVKREQRIRTIHEIELLEVKDRLVLFRVSCESGTYIRTLCTDMGMALGTGANMMELRRTRAGHFLEKESIPLQDLLDAYVFWKEDGDETELRKAVWPMEKLTERLPKIVVKDSAVDAICHGANLAAPGIKEVDGSVASGKLIALITGMGELIALAEAKNDGKSMASAEKGIVADSKRVVMKPGTYPRTWKKNITE